jgi:hypothetical protein
MVCTCDLNAGHQEKKQYMWYPHTAALASLAGEGTHVNCFNACWDLQHYSQAHKPTRDKQMEMVPALYTHSHNPHKMFPLPFWKWTNPKLQSLMQSIKGVSMWLMMPTSDFSWFLQRALGILIWSYFVHYRSCLSRCIHIYINSFLFRTNNVLEFTLESFPLFVYIIHTLISVYNSHVIFWHEII